jgi:beta-aspartyl-peptidase (threonine type)
LGDDARPAATRAGLLLSGGGGDVEAAWRWFVACAGGGDIVVLRAGGGDGYQKFIFEEIGGVASVTTIKVNDASASHDPALLARLAAAEGIFLAGGDQSRYVKFWKDTPVASALNAHLAAGKPLGGTSAGLAVLGEFYYSAMLDSVTSDQVLANPFDANVTLGAGFIAAPALAGVITDSHFMPRQRLGRLIGFLGRLQTDHPSAPRLVGLGVDEATALCVEPDSTARVHTAKNGSVWLVQLLASPAATVAAGRPLAARASVIGLGPESTLNLATLEVTAPLAVRTVSAADGKLVP